MDNKDKKVRRRRRNISEGTSRSIKLQFLVYCLKNYAYQHIITWSDRENLEFAVRFVHKANPNWNDTYLDLFQKFDELSVKKMPIYQRDKKYKCSCKGRFRSNMKKFCCPTGPLIYLGEEEKVKNYVTVKKFKFKSEDLLNSDIDFSDKNFWEKLRLGKKDKVAKKNKAACSNTDKSVKILHSNDIGKNIRAGTHYQCVSTTVAPNCNSPLLPSSPDSDDGILSLKPTLYGPSDQLKIIKEVVQNLLSSGIIGGQFTYQPSDNFRKSTDSPGSMENSFSSINLSSSTSSPSEPSCSAQNWISFNLPSNSPASLRNGNFASDVPNVGAVLEIGSENHAVEQLNVDSMDVDKILLNDKDLLIDALGRIAPQSRYSEVESKRGAATFDMEGYTKKPVFDDSGMLDNDEYEKFLNLGKICQLDESSEQTMTDWVRIGMLHDTSDPLLGTSMYN